ncbi:hypothetical protein EFR01_58640 [Sinorhizobium fredii]|nr:hypothetical protein EFR01_58640 [Sinorhizobium fredii]GLS11898.1 hypothetical protein GCM10007864_55300 [Sinorhizobium fredii]
MIFLGLLGPEAVSGKQERARKLRVRDDIGRLEAPRAEAPRQEVAGGDCAMSFKVSLAKALVKVCGGWFAS